MDNTDFTKSEERQYERIRDKLTNEFSDSEKDYYMLVDYIVGNKQYDIILFKNQSIIIMELKSYQGDVLGSENGDWHVSVPNNGEVKIKQKTNPFQQVRRARYDFIDFLNKKLPDVNNRFEDKNFKNISAILCFESGSSYDINQIDEKKNLWFDVISEDEIVDFIKKDDSKEFYIKNCEFEEFFSNLNVKKKGEENKEKYSSDGGLLSNEDIINVTQKLHDEYGKNEFNLKDITNSLESETAVRYLGQAEDLEILKNVGNKKFTFTEDYEENLPKKEERETDINVGRFSKEDFYLKPENQEIGEVYKGVYRGTRYSMNYKREVWWRRDWQHPKHHVEFSDEDLLEKIIEYKPQGGSFRITEAGEILTKIFDEDKDGYVPIYVGEFKGSIEFEDFSWNPKGLRKGDLWPAPYDGATFSVNGHKDLKIKIGNIKTKAIEGHEELVDMVLKFKGQSGGRFKINENGKVLTLLYSAPYPKKIQNQIKKLSDEEKNMIDIRSGAKIDEMVPIYVGTFSGNIKFEKIFDIHREWTEEDDKEFLERIGAI